MQLPGKVAGVGELESFGLSILLNFLFLICSNLIEVQFQFNCFYLLISLMLVKKHNR